MPLYRLTYVSTLAGDMSKPQLDALVATAAAKNDRLGVTGLLLFNELNFMQTLEGERAVIDQLMTTIAADRRHSGLIVIDAEDVHERAFPTWSLNGVLVPRGAGIAGNGLDRAALPRNLPAGLAQFYASFNSLQRDKIAG